MDAKEKATVVKFFRENVTLSRDEVLRISDQIRESGRPLSQFCNFTRPMQVRRLLTLAPNRWSAYDFNVCRDICSAINELLLLDERTIQHTAALACLGVLSDDGKQALLVELGLAPAPERPESQTAQGSARPKKAQQSTTRPER